ncbi:MAG: amino acid-binding protein [Phycisphaerae bacterium]
MARSKSDGVMPMTQFSVFLVNKPGVLARVCQQLADSKVNIMAMTMMDATEHGVLRIVAEKPEEAREALGKLDVQSAETPVIAAVMPNRPGAMADVVQRLASARVHIDYAYCTTGSLGGKTIGIFRVSDVARAQKILGERKPQRKEKATSRHANRARRTGS